MFLVRIYNVTINATISFKTILFTSIMCQTILLLREVVAILHCFRFLGARHRYFFLFLAHWFGVWSMAYHKEGGNRRIHVLLPVVPWYRWEALNTLAYCLTHFHPFGPSAGTDAHVAVGDEISSSGHPELLFKLLALLPKVQLTIVSCVPSRSCSSSSSRWSFEAELPLLLYCNHEEWINQ